MDNSFCTEEGITLTDADVDFCNKMTLKKEKNDVLCPQAADSVYSDPYRNFCHCLFHMLSQFYILVVC